MVPGFFYREGFLITSGENVDDDRNDETEASGGIEGPVGTDGKDGTNCLLAKGWMA